MKAKWCGIVLALAAVSLGRAANLVQNGGFEEPAILGSGQTDVVNSAWKMIVQNPLHSQYPHGIWAVNHWTNALDSDQSSDQGVARMLGLPAIEGAKCAFINRWNRRFSQTLAHTVQEGDVYRVNLWLGSMEAAARCARISLIAGRMSALNPDELEPGSAIIQEVTGGTPAWSRFQPMNIIFNVGWTAIYFDVVVPSGLPSNQPLTIALRTEESSVGPVYFDDVRVEVIGGPTVGVDDHYEAPPGTRIQGSVLYNDNIEWRNVEIVRPPRHAAFFSPPESGPSWALPDLFTYESTPGFIGTDDFLYSFTGYEGFTKYATCYIKVDAATNLSFYAAPDHLYRPTEVVPPYGSRVGYSVGICQNDRFLGTPDVWVIGGTYSNVRSSTALQSVDFGCDVYVEDQSNGTFFGTESGGFDYSYFLRAPDGQISNVAKGVVDIGWPYYQVSQTLPGIYVDDLRCTPIDSWAGYRVVGSTWRAVVGDSVMELPVPPCQASMATGYVRSRQFGHAVGWYADDAGAQHAYQWLVVGSTAEGSALPTLGGASSAAEDINDRRMIVGWSTDALGRKRPVLWTADGIRDLGTLGGPEGAARSINDEETIVGWATDASGRAIAFTWTPTSGMVALSTPAGYSSEAREASGQEVYGVLRNSVGAKSFAKWVAGVLQPPPTILPGVETSEWNDIGLGTVSTDERSYAVAGVPFEKLVRDANFSPSPLQFSEGLQWDMFWRGYYGGPEEYRGERHALLVRGGASPTTAFIRYVQPPWKLLDRQQGIGDPLIETVDGIPNQAKLSYSVIEAGNRVVLEVLSGSGATTFTGDDFGSAALGYHSQLIDLLDVDAPQKIQVRATIYNPSPEGGGIASYLVSPRPRVLTQLLVGPATGDGQRAITVQMNRKLDLVDTIVSVELDAPFGSAPASVRIPAGQVSTTFLIQPGPSSPTGTVTLTARLNGSTRNVQIPVGTGPILRGSVALRGLVGSPQGTVVRVTLRHVGTSVDTVRNVTLDAQGKFLVPAMAGANLVWVTSSRYLQKRVGPLTLGSGTTDMAISLTPGDCDGDNDVDIDDYDLLAYAYGSSSGQPTYNLNADLDGDGDVDIDDYDILAGAYGQFGD